MQSFLKTDITRVSKSKLVKRRCLFLDWSETKIEKLIPCTIGVMQKKMGSFFEDLTGAVEPNAQGCAFAHPIFGLMVNIMMVLRTQNFGLNYNLRPQSRTHSAAPDMYI